MARTEASVIGKQTLVPAGVACGVCVLLMPLVWVASAETTSVTDTVTLNSKKIGVLESKFEAIRASQMRIEAKLGTLPRDAALRGSYPP